VDNGDDLLRAVLASPDDSALRGVYEGCGCCVDLYRVEAPQGALDELPPVVFASSEWSGNQQAE
jgi:hypothetical protein